MATMSLSFNSLGIDYKPSIVYINRLSTYMYNRRELQYMRNCMYMGYRLPRCDLHVSFLPLLLYFDAQATVISSTINQEQINYFDLNVVGVL